MDAYTTLSHEILLMEYSLVNLGPDQSAGRHADP
jgi:hypothetical protein